MRINTWTFLALYWALAATRVNAHDVVWPGNPNGFNPQEPLRIGFGSNAVVEVRPVFGEPCFVAVNLDPLASTLVKAEVITVNPALQVDIRVTVMRAATNASEMAVISGEWHATGFPDPEECTATTPNLFAVTVQVLGGPPAATISAITPRAAPGGGTVTIEGNGFTGVTEVSFGEAAAEFVLVEDRTIRAVVPSNAPVGKVSVTTPGGKIESAAVFVVQPELKLMPDGTMVQLQWNNRNYPFTLQRSISISDPRWTDVITTLENSVNLPIESGPGFYRLSWMEIPLDLGDYNRDRMAVARFYHSDPINYWATFGIPALARLALIREDVNADPYTPFQGFLQGFDQQRFMALLENNELPPAISITVSNQLSAGLPVTNAFLNSLITLVRLNDATNCIEIVRTNCLNTNSLAPVFGKLLTNMTTSNAWSGWAPQTNKVLFNPNQLTNSPTINWIDTHGTHGFTQIPRPVRPPASDTNTTVKVRWDAITPNTFTNSTYNAACMGLAVGASLAKLGVIGDETSAYFWNELSRLLGATPGTLGAYPSDVAAFYETVGYGATEAYDGPLESAVEEAKKALERGCDALIVYYSSDNTRGHAEFVTGIDIDSADSTKATVSTLSWGENATVTYDGSASGGSYSGKSDGQRYRKSTETSSWLEQNGTAVLYYFCKK